MKALKRLTSVILVFVFIMTSAPMAWASVSPYSLSVDLFKRLIDDEEVINSYYLDLGNAYMGEGDNSSAQIAEVAAFGRQLTAGVTDNYQKAKVIFDWFENNFTYDYQLFDDVKNGRVNRILSDSFYNSFKTRKGVCEDYTMLFLVMAIASGVPTEYVASMPDSNNIRHIWNIFWYDKEKRWVLVDATWHIFDIPIEQFSNYDPEQLSFHYIGNPKVDDKPPTFYNSSAMYTSNKQIMLYKGQKYNQQLNPGNVSNVSTYMQFTGVLLGMSDDDAHKNIVIQDSFTIPKGEGPSLSGFNVTIAKQATVTIDGALYLTYMYRAKSVINVEGTLIVNTDGRLSLSYQAQINVKPGGKIVFNYNAALEIQDGKVTGANINIPSNGKYWWNGNRFIDQPLIIDLRDKTSDKNGTTSTYKAGTHVTGSKSYTSLIIDRNVWLFPGVNIDDRNWVKLRDMAAILNGTSKQFGVEWISGSNSVSISVGPEYVPVGNELRDVLESQVDAVATSQTLLLNGRGVEIDAFNINGSNYYRLVDLAALLNFSVNWDPEREAITLDLDSPYGQ